MTSDEEKAKAFELVARRDLQDIRALRDSEPFNRYFLRRLKAQRDEVFEHFCFDEPEKCDKEKREHLRQQWLLLNRLCEMMQTDEDAAHTSLGR